MNDHFWTLNSGLSWIQHSIKSPISFCSKWDSREKKPILYTSLHYSTRILREKIRSYLIFYSSCIGRNTGWVKLHLVQNCNVFCVTLLYGILSIFLQNFLVLQWSKKILSQNLKFRKAKLFLYIISIKLNFFLNIGTPNFFFKYWKIPSRGVAQ